MGWGPSAGERVRMRNVAQATAQGQMGGETRYREGLTVGKGDKQRLGTPATSNGFDS